MCDLYVYSGEWALTGITLFVGAVFTASLPSSPPVSCRGSVLCVAMGQSGNICFSGSADSNIRVWKVPPSDIDPYDTYGEPLDTLSCPVLTFA